MGATLKQIHRRRFLDLLQAYRAAIIANDTGAFVRVSIALHGASGDVPKSWRGMIGRTRRDAETAR